LSGKGMLRDQRRDAGFGGYPNNNGGGGNMTDLEKRVSTLEAQLVGISSKVDYLATKEDIANLKSDFHLLINSQTWKVVGAMVASGGLFFGLLKLFPGS
jgi:hypothetical protein